MRKKNNVVVFLIAFTLFVGIFCGYYFVEHEKAQNRQIQELRASIAQLSEEVKNISNKETEWLDEDGGYNYLAIGNSITLHGIADYWWNEVGMAASDEEHDYFHLVLNYLRENNDSVKGIPYNFSVWETQSYDRDEILEYLDPYLSPLVNLVTIQLGENASDLTTYQEDYISLINYVKEKAPNARVLVVGDFWSNGDRNEQKKTAIEKTCVEYVSLEGITDNKEYYCGMNAIVYDKDGGDIL